VYALGIVLYQLLVGRPPFEADDPIDLLYMHRHERAAAVSDHTPVSAERDELVTRCLEKDPAMRPHSMAQVRAALRSMPESAVTTSPGGLRAGDDDSSLTRRQRRCTLADTDDEALTNAETLALGDRMISSRGAHTPHAATESHNARTPNRRVASLSATTVKAHATTTQQRTIPRRRSRRTSDYARVIPTSPARFLKARAEMRRESAAASTSP
jgi:serine/threonine protein kinase